MHDDDAPAQALAWPFEHGTLAWPGEGLCLNARAAPALRALAGLATQQAYKPQADALARAGHAVDAGQDTYPCVLVLPPRQREALRATFARALDRCAEGGRVVASVANAAGAKSAEADLRALAGGLEGTLSKHHCRVFWARKDSARIDADLHARWRTLDAPRRIDAPSLPHGGFTSRPGVFAWDRIDPASALLAEHLPRDLQGHAADLGAGWGYLSIELLHRNPGLRALDVVEADACALALARDNLAPFASAVALDFQWRDATTGLARQYDVIVSNPPFHAHDRADRPELGQAFIRAAAQALRPGGRLFVVANRHLPYEATLAQGFAEVQVRAQRDGFKAIEARRAWR